MEKNNSILKVKDLSVFFDTDYGTVQILNNINFDVRRGEVLGIVGESGCGKSMTSMSVMRLIETPPGRIEGEIEFEGQNLLALKKKEMRKIRGNRISMIFQEPMTSLNPCVTIGDQMMEAIKIHQGLRGKAAKQKAIEALQLVGIPAPEQRIKEFPHQLSGGMRQRVMIAMAMSCQPELLIADEPTTALDVTIQAQVLELMKDLQKKTGTSIMFITHDLSVIAQMSTRVLVFYCGEIVEEAPVEAVLHDPKHPYAQGLLAALPRKGSKEDLYVIPGTVPPASKFPKGCVFAPRCQYATDKCHECKPEMYPCGENRFVKCFRYAEEEGGAAHE